MVNLEILDISRGKYATGFFTIAFTDYPERMEYIATLVETVQ